MLEVPHHHARIEPFTLLVFVEIGPTFESYVTDLLLAPTHDILSKHMIEIGEN